MKKRFWNRSLSLILVLVMALSLIPGGLFAVSAEEAEAPAGHDIKIDFAELAEEVSGMDWWQGLEMGSAADSIAPTQEGNEQYFALLDYLSENKDWTINEKVSNLTAPSASAKRIYLDAADDFDWAMRLYAGWLGMDETILPRNGLQIDLEVAEEAAGIYLFSLDAFLENTGSTQCPQGFYPGGGYCMVTVNGETALEQCSLSGGNSNSTLTGKRVTLRAGKNVIKIHNTLDFSGETVSGRRSLCLNSLNFKYLESGLVDDGRVSSLRIDFKEFAQKASQQSWWNEIGDTTDENVKVFGTTSASQNLGSRKDAYNEMLQYLAENECWTINEAQSQFSNPAAVKRLFIDNSANPFGLRFYTSKFSSQTTANPGYSRLVLDIQLPEGADGWYKMALEVFHESYPSNIPVVDSLYAGSPYGDIYVNGELIHDEFFFGRSGGNLQATHNFGQVYLYGGTNTFTIDVTQSYVEDLVNGRRTLNLCALEFKALRGVETSEFASTLLDLNDDYIAYGDTPAGFTVEVENTWVATASINNNGVITVNGISEGETSMNIMDGDEVYCTIPIRVKAFEGTFDDLVGNPSIIEFTTTVDRAEEQEWWNGTAPVTVDGQFNTWLKKNAKWSIIEADELIANGDDNTYGFAAKGENAFAVKLAAEGLYNISVEYLGGGTIMDVSVNGEALYEGLSTDGTGNYKRSLGTAVLKKGENTLTFTSDGPVYLRSLVFTPLGGWQTEVGVSRYIDLNETYLAYDAKLSAPTAASSNSAVAVQFDKSGKLIITGVQEGQSVVTVTDGAETICTLSVSVLAAAPMQEASFLLDGFRTEVLQLGQVAKGELSGKTENGTVLCEEYLRERGEVYFKSSDISVATVDQNTGNVTCVGEGMATIYAYAEIDGVLKQDSAVIAVSDDTDLVSIVLSANTDFVTIGNALILQVSGVRSSGGKADMSKIPLTYTVDDDEIAAVSEQGSVTGLASGTVTVTATVGVQRSAVTGSITLDVVDSAELPQANIILDFTNGRLGDIQTATLEEHDICINRESSFENGEKIKPYAKYGFAFAADVGQGMAFDFVVRRSGWYAVDTQGGLYTAGNISDIFVDNAYIGTIDFCQGKNGEPYNALCKGNTVWLDAGVHTVRLIAVTKGTQYLGKFTFFASPDPNPIAVKVRTEKSELLVNDQMDVSFDAVDANGRTYHLKAATGSQSYENHYVLEVSNSNISVAGGSVVGRKAGSAQVMVIGMVGKEVFVESVELEVVKGRVAYAELTAEQTTVKPDAAPFQLTATPYGVYDNALAGTFDITYESGDTSIAQVSADGVVTLTGKTGSVLITASIADDGRTVQAELWITVTKGKTAPTVFTMEERAMAQKNSMLYDWAWQQKETAVKNADFVVEHLDQFYDMIIPEGIPRSYRIVYLSDNVNYKYCPKCNTDIVAIYGTYAWKVDPIGEPWKITCPVCDCKLPSNDFGAYYASGIDEQGKFHPDRADKSLLVNELYPEMGEGWGVDDGFGYDTGTTTNGVPLVYTFIAHYVHSLYYSLSDHDINDMGYALNNLSEAYIYTGDEKYGSAGAILLDRMADVYPDYDIKQYSMEYANSHGGNGCGKIVGSIWEGVYVGQYLARAADAFWPAMDNDDVVQYLRARHVLKGVEDPETITPEYIRGHVDENILLDIKEGCETFRIAGNFGMPQAVMSYAAVALDRMPETEEMIDWTMRYGGLIARSGSGNYYSTGGNVMYNLVDLVDRDGFGNEVSTAYLGLWLSNLAKVSDALDGYTGVEGVDLWKNGKFVSLYKGYSNMIVVGRNTPIVGESGGMQMVAFPLKVDELLLAYQKTKDPEIAQILYFANGNSVDGLHGDIYSEKPEGIRNEIRKVIAERGELRFNDSVMLSGYGIGIMKEGPDKYLGLNVNADQFSAAWMYFGPTIASHAQLEALSMDLYSHGLSLSSTMGYPLSVTTSDPERMQWVSNTSSHNTVVVDDEAQSSMDYGGFPMHFDDAGKVKVMDAHAPAAYAQTEIYRRTMIQVLAPNGEPYTVDLFRVLGGSEHVYSFHVATMQEPKMQGLDMTKQPMGTYAGPDVPYGPYYMYSSQDATLNTGSGYSWLDDVYRDDAPEATFVLDYPVEDFRHQLASSAGLHLKMTMLSEEPVTEVALANGHPPQNGTNPEHVEYVMVRRSGAPGMDSLFTTVFEPYYIDDQIASSELVDIILVDGTELATDKTSAIKVTMHDGRVDYIVYATNYDCTYNVDGRFDFRGFIGVCSYYGETLVYAYGNEATKIAGIEETFLPAITGTVIDFTKDISLEGYTMTLKLDQAVTEEDFDGRYIYVNNDGERNAAYRIYGVELDGDVAVIDLHEQTLVRKFVDGTRMDLGYVYNIAEGNTFSIPVSASFDTGSLVAYTPDQVVKVGNKLSLTTGVAGSDVTYTANGLVTGMKLDAKTGALTWTPSRTQTGRYPVTIEALDTDGNVAAAMTFVIYVVNYTGSSYDADKCPHAKAVTYVVGSVTETVCPACSIIRKTAAEEIEKFTVAGSNMTLGNELEVNFMVKKSDLTASGCTAVITQTKADGSTVVTKLPQAQWGSMGSAYYVMSARIAAKEMADPLSIEIIDANGNVLNNAYTSSVRDYVGRALSNTSTTAKVKTMMVDMVNYGASAQQQFGYNKEDLANNALTAAQKALATAKVACTNSQVKGENLYGASLSLEESILLNVLFKGMERKDVGAMYAIVSFTDYAGGYNEITVPGTEFERHNADVYRVVVDDIVLADAKQMVTVTVYDADGSVYGSGTDSVESYVARAEANNADTYGLYANIMKFATSAHNYLKG